MEEGTNRCEVRWRLNHSARTSPLITACDAGR